MQQISLFFFKSERRSEQKMNEKTKQLNSFVATINTHQHKFEYLDIAKIQRIENEVSITLEQAYDVDIAFILKTAKSLKLNSKFVVDENKILIKVY